MTTRSATTNQDTEHSNFVTIWDTLRAIAIHLKGIWHTDERGSLIEIKNPDSDVRVVLCIEETKWDARRVNLTVEINSISKNERLTKLDLQGLKRLFVTWEAPQLISFTYASEDWFNLINIVADGRVTVLTGMDRRREREAQQPDVEAQKLRRIFRPIAPEPKKAERPHF